MLAKRKTSSFIKYSDALLALYMLSYEVARTTELHVGIFGLTNTHTLTDMQRNCLTLQGNY